jgi:hypothetical protein
VPVGRVVFTGSVGPVTDRLGIESRLRNISALSHSSSRLIKTVVSLAVDPVPCGSGVASLSPSENIQASEIAVPASNFVRR